MSEQQPVDARRERILDAAAKLLVRFGYTHTSTQAIAAQTSVSKATLYAYWPNKAHLFHALLVRESLRVLAAWEASVRADPAGGTIGPLFAHSFQALTVSPLLIALYSRDFASLGAVIRLRGTEVYTPRYLENLTFVRVLQANGVIRTDLSAETINHVMQALSLGIVTVGELIDSAVQPDFAATLATLGEMMQAALAPALPPAANQGKEAILAYFAGLREAMLASLIVSVTNEVE